MHANVIAPIYMYISISVFILLLYGCYESVLPYIRWQPMTAFMRVQMDIL